MKVLYSKKSTKDYWEDFWVDISRDPDKLFLPDDYPLFPICQYIEPSHKIADVGCGLGRFYKHYYYAGYDIVGIDYISEAIRLLKEENPEFNVYEGNITSLDFSDNNFDVTASFGTLSNLKNLNDLEKGFKELIRITRPGGIICCSLSPKNIDIFYVSSKFLLSQLWIALIDYLLLSYLKFKSSFKWFLCLLCEVLPTNLFSRKHLWD